ncbi:MAG: hypothetical protein KatS3mg108_0350 [Isosphaeraceae bacterium]|nr:MAG: hypothetical protein KatS3mg108_0350 [Isosphaeraceae bacterium]
MSVETRHRTRPGLPADPAERLANSPLAKAALVLVSLDEELARPILARLRPEEVEALSSAAERLETIDPTTRRAVTREFYRLALRRSAFTFDDLEHLQDVDLRAAFRADDAPTWALALAGAAPGLTRRVLSALGTTSAAALQQAIDQLGPFRLHATEAAQAAIVSRIIQLHDQALIALPEPRGGQEEIVV